MTRSEAKRHLNLQKWSEPLVLWTFWLRNVLRATTACTFSRSQLPKVARCFAPQRRALFRHLNFQKWSENGVLCTFWLGNVLRATMACTFSTSQLPKVLRATTACTFSTSQLPKVVRTPQFLTHFTSKCASRHNGVQLFISHLPRCLRTRRFSEPTFQPSGATKPRKNTVFRDFPTFSRTCIFFLLIFSLLTLLPADCFFISPYCRKFDFQTSFDDIHIFLLQHPELLKYCHCSLHTRAPNLLIGPASKPNSWQYFNRVI